MKVAKKVSNLRKIKSVKRIITKTFNNILSHHEGSFELLSQARDKIIFLLVRYTS